MFSPDYSHHIEVLKNIDKERKMSKEFYEITTTDKPNCVDELDGIPLKDGEKIELIWPDYTHTFETIFVKVWNNKTENETVVYSKAHVIITFKQLPAKIRIVGLKARRMK